MKYHEDLNNALNLFLKRNKNNILIGEDIADPYGGAFKITKGLSNKYPYQVISTPISEATILGAATGLYLKGHKVIAELMFGDFITLGCDQIINGISKFIDLEKNYSKKNNGSFILRSPMGAYRGYGSTHSQSLESIFLNIPNVNIFSPNIFSKPSSILDRCISSGGFTLFVEHKISYSREINLKKKNNFNLIIKNCEDYDVIKIVDQPPDFLILSYGYASEIALDTIINLFLKFEIKGEIISFKKIKNFKDDIYNEINSSKIVTLEEGASNAGWGSYISSKLYNKKFKNLDKQILVVGSENSSIPSSRKLEEMHLPNEEKCSKLIFDFFFNK